MTELPTVVGELGSERLLLFLAAMTHLLFLVEESQQNAGDDAGHNGQAYYSNDPGSALY